MRPHTYSRYGSLVSQIHSKVDHTIAFFKIPFKTEDTGGLALKLCIGSHVSDSIALRFNCMFKSFHHVYLQEPAHSWNS